MVPLGIDFVEEVHIPLVEGLVELPPYALYGYCAAVGIPKSTKINTLGCDEFHRAGRVAPLAVTISGALEGILLREIQFCAVPNFNKRFRCSCRRKCPAATTISLIYDRSQCAVVTPVEFRGSSSDLDIAFRC